MSDLRWGIVATGGIARTFTEDLHLNGFTVSAVGSRSLDTARAFASEYAIANAHGSYEALVADDNVDIVYVSTPHPWHADVAQQAIAAGKHVLIEKPFTVRADEARSLRQAAHDAGVIAMEAMWTRYLPHMVRIRELIASGALGDIRALSADHTQALSEEAEHRVNNLALGGGALLDLGVYPISFAIDMLGIPTDVAARARLGRTGADTEVATIMTHADGAISTTLSSSRAVGSDTAWIAGSDARIEIDRVWYGLAPFQLIAADGTVLERFAPPSDVGRGMGYQADALEEAVRSGDPSHLALGIDESVAIMDVLDDIRRQIGVTYPGDPAPLAEEDPPA